MKIAFSSLVIMAISALACGERAGEASLSPENFTSFSEAAEKMRTEALYYPNGVLKEIRSYSKETHKQHGKWEEYYENGQLKSEEYYEHGKKLGEGKEYYENGNLKEIGNGRKGEEYYENGKLKATVGLKDGKPDGIFMEYYENGQLKQLMNVKDGELHGEYKSCDENGRIWATGNYVNGEKDGQWREKQIIAINGQRIVATFGSRNGHVSGGHFGGSTAHIDQRTRGAEYGDVTLYYKNGQLVR